MFQDYNTIFNGLNIFWTWDFVLDMGSLSHLGLIKEHSDQFLPRIQSALKRTAKILIGDDSYLSWVFVERTRNLVGNTVPQSVAFKILLQYLMFVNYAWFKHILFHKLMIQFCI